MQLLLMEKIPELSKDATMYAFASGITTAMLSGIGIAVGIMVCMTVAALFHRAAMGGKQDQKQPTKPGFAAAAGKFEESFVWGYT